MSNAARSHSRPSARRNVYVALLAQWVAACFSILSTVLISRLMLPHELGIFAVTMGFTAILSVLQNAGAHEFLLYRKEDVDLDLRRSAYGLSLVTSLLVAFALIVLSPLVARFYDEPRMTSVMLVLALQTAISVLASPIMAILARQERFQLISLVSLLSSITLSVLQIVLTWLGFGPVGLAWAMVASSIVFVGLNLAWAGEYFLFYPNFRHFREIFGFGSKLLGTNLMVQINNNVPQIIIGHVLGLTTSAMYSRANATTQIYSQTVARALDPIINARIAAEGRSRSSSDGLILTSQALLAISGPFFGFIAIYAPWFVPFMFGPQWNAAILPTTVLCWGFLVWPLASPISAVLLSKGRPGLLLKIRTINTLFRAGAVVLLASTSLTLVCAGISFGLYLYLFHGLIAMRNVAGISIRMYLGSLLKSLAVSIGTLAAAGVFALSFRGSLSPIAMLVGGGTTAGLAWIVALAATRHFIWSELLHLVHSRLRRPA